MSQAQVMSSGARPNGVNGGAGGQPSRLDRWMGAAEAPQRKFIPLTPEMVMKLTAQQLLEITTNNLSILGEQYNAEFLADLPNGHRLVTPKQFKPQVLQSAPYMGACKIGEVMLAKKDGKILTHQMFMANFIGQINTADPSKLYIPTKKEVSNTPKMFFGLNVVVDAVLQNPLGFQRTLGKDGVSFQTTDKEEAMYLVNAAATGRSVEAVRAQMAPRMAAAR